MCVSFFQFQSGFDGTQCVFFLNKQYRIELFLTNWILENSYPKNKDRYYNWPKNKKTIKQNKRNIGKKSE